MTELQERKHFIVKHDLEAFSLLPNYIWRTDKSASDVPRGFANVTPGDRWISFAYTNSDKGERPLSKVTGFFECVGRALFGEVPLPTNNPAHGWLIEGRVFDQQPIQPAGVPPIDDLLGRKTFSRLAIVPINAIEFEHIRNYTLTHQLDTTTVPLLGREPECEQEVVALIAHSHKKFGISKILRVRTGFPDLLVQFEQNPTPVHLELELYSESFLSHGHQAHVTDKRYNKDGLPVAVACWIHNEPEVEKHVHKVFELQELIRKNKVMVW